MNNLYVRWLGYKHPNDRINYDSVSRDDQFINEYTLNESKRILLQYDHILLLEKKNMEYSPRNNLNWKFFMNEFQPISLNEYYHLNETDLYQDVKEKIRNKSHVWNGFKHEMNSDLILRDDQNEILHSKNYKELIERNGEIQLLLKYNQLDLNLYEYAKILEKCDHYFIKYLFE